MPEQPLTQLIADAESALSAIGPEPFYFPLVPYYNLRPRDPNLPPAADWLAARRGRAVHGPDGE